MEKCSEDLSDTQRKILEQFRYNLKDVLSPDHTDATLIKWLRAKNFHLKDATKIFMENYYNRIIFGINTVLEHYEKHEVCQKHETWGILGFAKDGTLIRYIDAGKIDWYGFVMSMSCYELCIYLSYMMEHDIQLLKKENEKTGRNIIEITYIVDLEGFGIQQFLHKNVIEMGLDYTRLIQDCYPEIWSQMLIVNAPIIFDTAFNIFKPVLRANVLERMKVANKDSSRELLLKYIDEDVLPAFLGGKKVDSNGDPRCEEFITFSSKVSEELYSHNRLTLLQPTDPGVQTHTIGAGSVFNKSLVVKEGGSRIKFEMRTENGSLTFSVLYKEFGPDPDDPELPAVDEKIDENDENSKYRNMSVTMRAQSHCTPESLVAFLPFPGIYVMRLSNASSWFTSRKVIFRYSLLPPISESPW